MTKILTRIVKYIYSMRAYSPHKFIFEDAIAAICSTNFVLEETLPYNSLRAHNFNERWRVRNSVSPLELLLHFYVLEPSSGWEPVVGTLYAGTATRPRVDDGRLMRGWELGSWPTRFLTRSDFINYDYLLTKGRFSRAWHPFRCRFQFCDTLGGYPPDPHRFGRIRENYDYHMETW